MWWSSASTCERMSRHDVSARRFGTAFSHGVRGMGMAPLVRAGPSLCAYRVEAPADTPAGTPAYPTARVVNVPLPWVRLRKRVA